MGVDFVPNVINLVVDLKPEGLVLNGLYVVYNLLDVGLGKLPKAVAVQVELDVEHYGSCQVSELDDDEQEQELHDDLLHELLEEKLDEQENEEDDED